MPTLEAIFSRLNGATWFSTIDLTSAFFHVEMHEKCRHLTNFFAGNGRPRGHGDSQRSFSQALMSALEKSSFSAFVESEQNRF